MSVFKLVLTGGPCAGKSTGLSRIEQELTNRGYKVYIVAESATELITGGVNPSEISLLQFQKGIFELQYSKECIYKEQAEKYSEQYNKDCIIVLDRGLLDGKSFMTDKEFKVLLKLEGKREVDIRDSYDGVFHLITAANGAESFYTLGNNAARRETIEEACKADKQGIRAWTGHPHLRVIDNSTGFEEKIGRLMKEIYSLLGEPIPTEIERKYLIKMPNIENLFSLYDITKSNIIQTYLNSNDKNVECRIRQRGIDGDYSYYYTEKQGSGLSRVEKEKKINERQYLEFLMNADTSLKQIRKDRYCFVYKNNYIELDIYPFWSDYAIVEVELTNENDEVELPLELEVVKEVTNDIKFKNRSLAKDTDII